MQKRKTELTKDTIMLTIPQLAERYQVGIATATRVAAEAGAFYYVGGTKRVLVEKVDSYIFANSPK